jgi:hypothetical protein
LNHIWIPYEMGNPTVYNPRLLIGTARHYVALHFWQTHDKTEPDGAASHRPTFDPQGPQS